MKKAMIYIITVVLTAIGTVCALNITSAKATEPPMGIAEVVAKAREIQDGTWDSSLGPYKEPNGDLNYRYILVRGEGSDVTFELLAVGGLESLSQALVKALG